MPLDDSWIHFQFARNVARGYGFSYNPGQETPGSTSPLWVYVLAGVYNISGDFVFASKLLGFLFLIVTIWAMYSISLRVDPNRWCAFFTALFSLNAGRLFWGILSGMEIGLFTSLTILGIFMFLKYEATSWKSFVGTILFGLATLARPEGAALFLFLMFPFGLLKIGRMVLRGDKRTSILVLWFLGLPLLNALINPITWHHGRYIMFLIPLFFLFSVHGFFFGFESMGLKKLRMKEGFLILSLVCSLGLLVHWSRIYAEDVDNVNQMDVRMGKWIESNLPQDAIVAASDVGAIAFFSGRTIIDTDGLVTPEIIPYRREMGRENGVFQYLLRQKPDFVVAFHNEFQFLSTYKDMFEPLYSHRVVKNTILGGERMVAYRAHWSAEQGKEKL